MRSLHEDLDRLFEQRLGMDETAGSVANWTPPVDIQEEEHRFVLHADIPGVTPEDIEVTMENGVLEVIIPKHDADAKGTRSGSAHPRAHHSEKRLTP